MRERYNALAIDVPDSATWIGATKRFYYRKSVKESNVDNAYRLRGNVLLVVGELDTNVDPSSTMQVVKALLKANKTFDLLVLPGQNHNAARGGEFGAYGERKRFDFFVQHLLGAKPPAWNETPTEPRPRTAAQQQR